MTKEEYEKWIDRCQNLNKSPMKTTGCSQFGRDAVRRLRAKLRTEQDRMRTLWKKDHCWLSREMLRLDLIEMIFILEGTHVKFKPPLKSRGRGSNERLQKDGCSFTAFIDTLYEYIKASPYVDLSRGIERATGYGVEADIGIIFGLGGWVDVKKAS